MLDFSLITIQFFFQDDINRYASLPPTVKKVILYYFHSNYVLELSEGLHDLGGLRWELAGCLFACWAFVFFCLLRGVKSMGKVGFF